MSTYTYFLTFHGGFMNFSFEEWSQQMLGPDKAEFLTDLYNLCASVLGESVETVMESHIAVTGIDGNQEIIDRVYAEFLEFAVVSINQFGIILNDSTLSIEDLSKLKCLLEALLQMDQYELPQEIIDLREGTENNKEFLFELVTRITDCDVDDFPELVYSVPDVLIDRIIETAKDRIDFSGLDIEIDPISQINIQGLAWLVNAVEIDSDIVEYYRNGNTMGHSLAEYLSVFANGLYEVNDLRQSALLWLILWTYTGESYEFVSAKINPYLETLYADASRSMATFKEIRVVLQEMVR